MDRPGDELASLIERARLLAAAGQWDSEAVDINTRILKLRPRSLVACNRLATCCLHLGYLDQAEKLCLHILRIDPANVKAQQRLDTVTIRREHEKIAREITTFEDAFQEGVRARRRGNNDLAVVLLELACRLRSDTASRIALAASYRATERLADAEGLYVSILQEGYDKAAVVGLAAVLRDQGRLDPAAVVARDVLERFPDDTHAVNSLTGVTVDKRKAPWERKSFLKGVRVVTPPPKPRDLFQTPVTPVQAYFDGLCAPYNPGGYAYGGWYIAPHPAVPMLAAGAEGHAFYCRGAGATNNIAEYNAALDALRAVYRSGYRGHVLLHGDSQLVVNQFNGKRKCRKQELQALLDRLHHAATFFHKVEMMWIPRERNLYADKLSRQAYCEETGSNSV